MPDFVKMSLEDLIAPQGYACDCGEHHEVAVRYLARGRGAVSRVGDAVLALQCKRPFVVYDENTYRAAHEAVSHALTKAGINFTSYVIPCHKDRISPAEWELGSIFMHYDPRCDMFLAVGSGVINDLCKVAAYATNKPSAIVGTAPSMDGFASNSSSMEVNGVKVTLYNQCPSAVVCDAEIMANAPKRMLFAGIGDMLAKYTSICEWRISNLVTGEPYCENVAAMIRASVREVVANAKSIVAREPEALQILADALVKTGMAMAYVRSSRPASGMEHYFSHIWEMMALSRNRPYDLHGIQVGVGTVLTIAVLKNLSTLSPSRAEAEIAMRDFNPAVWKSEMHRVFGVTAPEMIAAEKRYGKNDPEKHAVRLDNILAHWEEILQIIHEELPDLDELKNQMHALDMPMLPSQIGISTDDAIDAFIHTRDIRDKYLISSLLWDIGKLAPCAEFLRRQISADAVRFG